MGTEGKRRVAITGMGVVSSIGAGILPFWEALVEGRSGITPITHFDATDFPSKISGYIGGFDPSAVMTQDMLKHTSRFQHLSLDATEQAMRASNLVITPENTYRIGMIGGSGTGGFEIHDKQVEVLRERGWKGVDPYFIPKLVPDALPALLSIMYDVKGHMDCAVAACASGTKAIGMAYEVISYGKADAVICPVSEAAITPVGFASFCAPRALSTRNDDYTGASRPFDLERDGFVMGEGAATLILEEWKFANARGANILAEVVGYGNTCEGYHRTSPDPSGDGAARAMEMALRDADLEPDHIGYYCAHGTATRAGDAAEGKAIQRAFGDRLLPLAVSSIKGTIGHTLGASGAIAAVACVEVMRTGIIPPTINLDTPDRKCGRLDHVANVARKSLTNIHFTMLPSFGFGGHNAVVILGGAPTRRP